MRLALSSPRLRRLLSAYSVNRLGTWIGLVALMVTVYEHTHDALAVALLLLAGQALPAFCVPGLVARVEASKRRGELSALYAFEAVVTAALIYFVHNFSLAPICVLVALDGTAALAASALLRAEVAKAGRTELAGAQTASPLPAADDEGESPAERAERTANAALNVAFSITFVLGPVLAGILVASAGASVALLVDAGSFLVCAAMLVDLRPHVEEAGGESVRSRLKAAWTFIKETPSLRVLLAVEMVALVFFETAAPIEVTFAKTTINAGDRGFGLLLTTWGAGTVIGSLVFARSMRRPLGYLISGGTVLVGVGYVGFSLAPSLAVACVAALAGGIGNGIELPSLFSIVQQLVPARLHGRLMGGVESMGALAPVIGLPLGGLLVAISGPRTAFLTVGACTVVAGLALLYVMPAQARRRAPPEDLSSPGPPALEAPSPAGLSPQ